MISPEAQRKHQLQEDLKRQMAESERRKKASRERKAAPEEYFPFGKPGAGAPYRDQHGHIISNRPPHFNENDPAFLRTSEYYKTLSHREEQNGPP